MGRLGGAFTVLIMSNDYFQFKQFKIIQEKTAMKVGTDGVLLGAWTDIQNSKSILDIGTGTGLIALMLAQKSNADIEAVEINNEAFFEAEQNIVNSKWDKRIKIYNISFQEFCKSNKKFDLIVTNPPYFIDSMKSPELNRTIARHNNELSYKDLLLGVDALLNKNGIFCLILPYEQTNKFLNMAQDYNLFCTKKTIVKPTLNKQANRVLLELQRTKQIIIENELIIEDKGRHQYSKEYIELTKDFYLKM